MAAETLSLRDDDGIIAIRMHRLVEAVNDETPQSQQCTNPTRTEKIRARLAGLTEAVTTLATRIEQHDFLLKEPAQNEARN